MLDFLARLFDTSDFPARWYCGNWTTGHGWLHILSDLGVWSAYVAIPCVLGYFVVRRKDIPFRTIFLLFGAYILACGATHLMEAILFWWPAYRLAGVIKLFTAVVSWGTVLALVRVVPKMLVMRSPEELEREITRRKQAENALQRANAELEARVQERTAALAEANASFRYEREMLRITLASIGDAVMVTDLKGRVTFLNTVAQTLTGWKEADAKGQPLEGVFRIINEKSRKAVESPALRALKEGTIVGLANHTILLARDGTERAIDDSAAPIRHEDGTVAGAVLVFRDVTEQRKVERSRRSLAAIVQSSDDAIIGKDMNGVITSWNEGAERIFGYKADEAIGRPVAMLAPPDRADEMPAILGRLKQGERIDHFDTVRRAKDGRLIPISLTVSPIKDEDGEVVGASKIARDISERTWAEESLRAEKALLQATLVGIGDAVIVTDAGGRVSMMNPVAQDLTGWKEEAVSRPLDDVFRIINEQSRQPVENPVSTVMREGTIVGLANHTILIAKNGTELPIDDSAAPIRDSQGQIIGCVLVFRGITERRRTEEAFRRITEQLQIVTESMAAPVTRCSRDLKYVWVNKPYAAWIARPAHEIVGHPIIDVLGREAFEQLRPHFEEVLAGRVVRYEKQVHFQGIGPRWINAVYTPTLDGHGVPDGWVAVVNDIDDRKKVETALREAENQFHQMADSMPQIVWTARPDGYLDYYNERWYEYTGFPRGEYGQQSWEPILHPDDVQRCVDTYFGCIKAERPLKGPTRSSTASRTAGRAAIAGFWAGPCRCGTCGARSFAGSAPAPTLTTRKRWGSG